MAEDGTGLKGNMLEVQDGGDSLKASQQAAAGPDTAADFAGYKSMEDLVEGHKALVAKMHAEGAPKADAPPAEGDAGIGIPEPDEAPPATEEEKAALNTAKSVVSEEELVEMAALFEKDGVISEDHYKLLETRGVNREIVDGWIAGQMALRERASFNTETVKNEFGGKKAVGEMVAWAVNNWPADQKATYNELANSGDPTRIRMALTSLKQAYVAAEGGEPSQVLSGGLRHNVGNKFESVSDLSLAMQDPRYHDPMDSSYRDEVMKKFKASEM